MAAPAQASMAAGPRRLAVLGATGRTGRQFLAQAAQSGHLVRGLCRHAARPELDPLRAHVDFVECDVWTLDGLQTGLRGCDAVLCFLEFSRELGGCCDPCGTRRACGRSGARYRAWARLLVEACEAERVPRVVMQTSWFSQSPLADPRKLCATGNCLILCCLRGVWGAGMWAGFQAIEDELAASKLDYTVVHCPILNQHGTTTHTTRGFHVATGTDQLGLPGTACCLPTGCTYVCCSQRTYPDVARFFLDNLDNFQRQSVVFQ